MATAGTSSPTRDEEGCSSGASSISLEIINSDMKELDLSKFEGRLDKSDYIQALFPSIQDVYPTDSDVFCNFILRRSLQATSKDYIGLYKIGLQSVRDYICYEYIGDLAPDGNGNQSGSVTFKGHSLPDDDDEFYQFCYTTSQGKIRGASTPFQFKIAGANDFVALEDDNLDLMIVESKTNFLTARLNQEHEALLKSNEENKILLKAQEMLDKEHKAVVAEHRHIIEELEVEKVALETKLKKTEEKMEQLLSEAKDMSYVHTQLTENISRVNKDKDDILKRLDENDQYINQLQEEIKNLQSEKDEMEKMKKMYHERVGVLERQRDDLVNDCQNLEEEKAIFKSQFTTSECAVTKKLETIEALTDQLTWAEKELEGKNTELITVKTALMDVTATLERKQSLLYADKTRIEDFAEKLRNAEDKLQASEQIKTVLNTEVEELRTEFQKAMQTLTSQSEKEEKMKNKLSKLTADIASRDEANILLNDEIKELQERLESTEKRYSSRVVELESKLSSEERRSGDLVDEEKGTFIALLTAQEHLKEQLTKAAAKIRTLEKEKQRQLKLLKKHLETEVERESELLLLRQENETLKERLKLGAKEYKKKAVEAKVVQMSLRQSQQRSLRDEVSGLSERSSTLPRSQRRDHSRRSSSSRHAEKDVEKESTAAAAMLTSRKNSDSGESSASKRRSLLEIERQQDALLEKYKVQDDQSNRGHLHRGTFNSKPVEPSFSRRHYNLERSESDRTSGSSARYCYTDPKGEIKVVADVSDSLSLDTKSHQIQASSSFPVEVTVDVLPLNKQEKLRDESGSDGAAGTSIKEPAVDTVIKVDVNTAAAAATPTELEPLKPLPAPILPVKVLDSSSCSGGSAVGGVDFEFIEVEEERYEDAREEPPVTVGPSQHQEQTSRLVARKGGEGVGEVLDVVVTPLQPRHTESSDVTTEVEEQAVAAIKLIAMRRKSAATASNEAGHSSKLQQQPGEQPLVVITDSNVAVAGSSVRETLEGVTGEEVERGLPRSFNQNVSSTPCLVRPAPSAPPPPPPPPSALPSTSPEALTQEQPWDSLISLPECPFCTMLFSPDKSPAELQEHVNEHLSACKGKECPMCPRTFSEDCTQDQFENHVYSHFNNC